MSSENIDLIASLSDAHIAAYLKQHPDFLQRHPDVLADQELRHETGEAISLVARQITALRERNESLSSHLDRLLDIARDNDLIFTRIRQLTLDMLQADTLSQLIAVLLHGLKEDFSIEFMQLILFTGLVPIPDGVRIDTLSHAQDRIPLLLRAPSICGLLRIDELDYLFGVDGAMIGSAAVLHLSLPNQKSLGLLAIGHREREHFRSSMDTLFVNFLGDVFARLLDGF